MQCNSYYANQIVTHQSRLILQSLKMTSDKIPFSAVFVPLDREPIVFRVRLIATLF